MYLKTTQLALHAEAFCENDFPESSGPFDIFRALYQSCCLERDFETPKGLDMKPI